MSAPTTKTARIPQLASWSKYNSHAGARIYRYELFIKGVGYFNITKVYAQQTHIGWQIDVTPEVQPGYCEGIITIGEGQQPADCLKHAIDYLATNPPQWWA